jgi:hypothetical protein
MFLILNSYLNINIYIHDETPNTLITNYIYIKYYNHFKFKSLLTLFPPLTYFIHSYIN